MRKMAENTVKLTAISPRDASILITKSGGFIVTEAMIAADLDAGAPQNPDGTINLINYAAWLVLDRRN